VSTRNELDAIGQEILEAVQRDRHLLDAIEKLLTITAAQSERLALLEEGVRALSNRLDAVTRSQVREVWP